jgi:hypothetical protein
MGTSCGTQAIRLSHSTVQSLNDQSDGQRALARTLRRRADDGYRAAQHHKAFDWR